MTDDTQRRRMMTFDTPDEETLQAWGLVSVRHGALERILRMTIKTLADVTVNEALDATRRENIATIRRRIRVLGKQRLGEGEALVRLQALVGRCESATQQRNELMHGIWARDMDDGEPYFQADDHEWRPQPTPEELTKLANEIAALVSDINEARLGGFLNDALAQRK